jgi:NAD(P)-dependent dehydrogenase (short-subunit alcohol dehydrogenase family)
MGKAASRLLARQGASIGALGRNETKVSATVKEIEAGGGHAIALVADIGDPTEMELAVTMLVGKYGRLDIVFANAGINGVWAPIEEIAPEEWDETIRTNLTGTFLTMRYAVPHLKKQGGSAIITSSVNGTRMFSNTGSTAYSTTKAGQVAFTQMLALELAPHKVRVNVICPGAIETDINETTEKRDLDSIQEPVVFPRGHIPLSDGKPGKAEQVAELVLFLASDRSSHITGTPIWIDGAESLLKG